MPASRYLLALALTLVCEAPVVALGYRRIATRWPVVFLVVNLFTHGLLWTMRPGTPARVAAAEAMIVLVEAGLYARLLGGGAKRALATSLGANALSLAVGLTLQWSV